MAIDVTADIKIARPRAEVAAFVTDPANDQTWIKAFTSVEVLTDPPTAVGSRVKRVAGFMGRRIDYVMQTLEGPFPMTVHYEFDDSDPDTLVRVRNQGGSGVMASLFSPLMGWMVNRQVKKDLALLKSVLER